VFDNAGIDDFLGRLFSLPGLSNDFRRVRKPLYLVATDLDSGTSVAFGAKGFEHVPIATAIKASAALPGLYPPVEIDGRWYVDGALKKDAACVRRPQGRGASGVLHQPAGALRRQACRARTA
jgi:NTE family protein